MKNVKNSKIGNTSLWIAQGILAAVFLMSGIVKMTQPITQLAGAIPWVRDVSETLVRFIGFSESLGALGLILPSLLRIKPMLTVAAAIGIILIMCCALVFHLSRNEVDPVGINIVLAFIAGFVAWGRLRKSAV